MRCNTVPATSASTLFAVNSATKPSNNSVRHLLTDPVYLNDILDELELRFGRPDQLIHCQTEEIKDFIAIEMHQIHGYTDFSSLVQNVCAYLNKDASRHVLGETGAYGRFS